MKALGAISIVFFGGVCGYALYARLYSAQGERIECVAKIIFECESSPSTFR